MAILIDNFNMNGKSLKKRTAWLLACFLIHFLSFSEANAQPQAQREILPPPMTEAPQRMPARLLPSPSSGQLSVRIKDITRLKGVRTNKLTGLGLVTGLNGTGSKNPVTRQFALNLLERFDLRA